MDEVNAKLSAMKVDAILDLRAEIGTLYQVVNQLAKVAGYKIEIQGQYCPLVTLKPLCKACGS